MSEQPFIDRLIEQIAVTNDILRQHEAQLAAVRGAIIGALAGGHLEGPDGASYARSVLLQIADLLHIALPEGAIK